MRRCRPSDHSALIEVQASRTEVIRPPNVVNHVVYPSAPGLPGQDLVLVPRSLLEERGMPLPPSAYSQQYPPTAGCPDQANMESIRQSSSAYVSQAQEQQQKPSSK
ncbi:hypothetical protein BGZ75_008303 [Mortierella antarctica]|nr:hypothetical protein BGZ67_005796 [Mortierella alpina]KAF9988895.1 hypothetical protein BGZ75_008303 [Mortierella antarctica]